MENASKALIFAASTIIAIIILSFMVYIFRRFGATAKSTEKRYTHTKRYWTSSPGTDFLRIGIMMERTALKDTLKPRYGPTSR